MFSGALDVGNDKEPDATDKEVEGYRQRGRGHNTTWHECKWERYKYSKSMYANGADENGNTLTHPLD